MTVELSTLGSVVEGALDSELGHANWKINVTADGYITASGTPTANQLAVFTDATTVEGSAGLSWDGTDFGVTGNITVSGTVDGVDIASLAGDVAALASGMVYAGNWDASSGSFPGGGTASTGAFYTVSVSGTVDGEAFEAGDRLIAITDDASETTFAANWTRVDATDAVQSVAGLVGTITDSALRTALNVADGADVSPVTSVAGETGVISAGDLRTALNVEDGATADQTGAEIVTAIDTELGGSTWQSGGGSIPAQDDGVQIVAAPTALNFTGAGITVTDVGGVATIDVPGGGSSTVDVVSNVATNTILGRTTAGSGDSEELTAAQVRTLLNVADGADVSPVTSVAGETGVISAGDLRTALNVEDGATADQTGAEIEALLDTELGSTDWKTGGGIVPIQDDSVEVLSEPSAINFTGEGVTVTDVGGVATVNISGDGGSTASFDGTFDADYVPAGYTIDGNQVTNDSAGDMVWVFGVIKDPLPATGQWYWEVVLGGDADNCYIGMVDGDSRSSATDTTASTGLFNNGMAWWENTGMSIDGSSSSVSGLDFAATGGEVLQFLWDADTNTLQVGLDNTISASTFVRTFTGGAYIAINVRKPTCTAQVFTATADLTYAPPSGYTALGEAEGSLSSGIGSLDDLTDVDTTTAAPTDGQALVWNNADSTWEPGDISTSSSPFRGFRAVTSADQNVTGSVLTTVTFDTEDFDTENAFASNVFTVPASLDGEYMVFSGGVGFAANESGNVYITRDTGGGPEFVSDQAIESTDSGVLTTGVIQVSTGDTFELQVVTSDASTVDSADVRVFFTGHVVNGSGYNINITEQTADYDVTNADLSGNQYLEVNLSTGITITVPSGLTGTEPLTIEQTGSGTVTIAAGAGVTINSRDSLLDIGGQYGAVTLVPKGSDVYTLIGDLA